MANNQDFLLINGLRVNGAVTSGVSVTAPSFVGSLTGNASTASMLSMPVSGDVSIAANSLIATLANTGVIAGTYSKVTVDAKGRVTSGTNPNAQLGSYQHGTVPISSGTTTVDISLPPTMLNGSLLWTATVTPLTTTSKLIIYFSSVVGTSSNNRGIVFSLFRNGVLISSAVQWADSNKPQTEALHIVDAPNSLGPQIYTFRVGLAGGNGTWYVGAGSSSSNQDFGGTNSSSWCIVEIL